MPEMVINIPSSLVFLKLHPDVSTGPRGCDTSPGIGFDIKPYPEDNGGFPNDVRTYSGVISRTDAMRMYKMLRQFFVSRGEL